MSLISPFFSLCFLFRRTLSKINETLEKVCQDNGGFIFQEFRLRFQVKVLKNYLSFAYFKSPHRDD